MWRAEYISSQGNRFSEIEVKSKSDRVGGNEFGNRFSLDLKWKRVSVNQLCSLNLLTSCVYHCANLVFDLTERLCPLISYLRRKFD